MSGYAIPRPRFAGPIIRKREEAEWERGPIILLAVLLSVLALYILGFAILMGASPMPSKAPVPAIYPYSLLEADRAHLQFMSNETGSLMHMENDPMSLRATDPLYLAQLQQQMDEINRMLGKPVQP